ncbi:hypothetical protein DFJ43DRAFT_1221870 [Lentinula guzmanii]|uniref:Uncharacterized protein n=1 Tax=Lentinula guzmanii TaxID=2804957 RepID=A0AA38JFQ9_9AGAR|nr:hypothetical protein DFJ43DRAFT_1221870 [Lentinula guzmanii]
MASPILKLSLALQAAFNDPEVLIFTKGVAFKKLESLMHAVMSKASNESHLYGLLFHCLSTICIASEFLAQDQDNSKPVPQLECYNQADYRVTAEGTTQSIRIPDYTVFVVDSQLRPAFTVEVKPLAFKDPGVHDWRLNPDSRTDALVHFGNTISQLREQAQYVFATYPHLEEHYAFLQVGYFFSVLLFKKENEKKVCDLETESEHHTPNRRPRRYSVDNPDADLEPTIYLEENILPRNLLPDIICANQPILMGKPVNSYNEVFRYVLSIVLKKHGFVLQNSWLSLPEAGYVLPTFGEERKTWEKCLLKGYSATIASHMDHRKQERVVDQQLTPEDRKDVDYVGPPTTPTPSHRTLRNRSTTAASSSSTRGGRGRRTGN